MSRSRPLPIHTWNRPSAASRDDCRRSATTSPGGGPMLGIGSGLSVEIEEDGDPAAVDDPGDAVPSSASASAAGEGERERQQRTRRRDTSPHAATVVITRRAGSSFNPHAPSRDVPDPAPDRDAAGTARERSGRGRGPPGLLLDQRLRRGERQPLLPRHRRELLPRPGRAAAGRRAGDPRVATPTRATRASTSTTTSSSPRMPWPTWTSSRRRGRPTRSSPATGATCRAATSRSGSSPTQLRPSGHPTPSTSATTARPGSTAASSTGSTCPTAAGTSSVACRSPRSRSGCPTAPSSSSRPPAPR